MQYDKGNSDGREEEASKRRTCPDSEEQKEYGLADVEAGSGRSESRVQAAQLGSSVNGGPYLAPAASCSQLSGTFIFTSSFLENLTEDLRHEAV